jgi:hypothetical protein
MGGVHLSDAGLLWHRVRDTCQKRYPMLITVRCCLALLAVLLTVPGVTQAQDRLVCSAASECNADMAVEATQRAVTRVETFRRPIGELPQGTAVDASGYAKDVPGPVAEPDRRQPRTRGYEETPCGFDRYGC